MIPNVISRAASRSTRRLAAVSAVHIKLAADCTVPSRRSSPCENDEEIGETRENNNTAEGGYDEEGRQIGQPLELEDASLDTEPLNDKELMTVPENEDLNTSGLTLLSLKTYIYDNMLQVMSIHYLVSLCLIQRKKNGGKCSRVDVLVATRTRKSEKADEINKLKEQREQGLNEKTDEKIIQDVLGKDTHGYLKAYGPGRSITQHFKVNPSQIDLTQEVNEVKKKADQAIEDARKEAENSRTEAEQAKLEVEHAKKEAEAIKNDVDRKIAENNAVWEKKFSQLLDFLGAGSSSDTDDLGSEGSKE
uniref:Uncharacterized protein n=1 Tax=Chenopodium quinoa TaxID=63459 RepID=A0A803NAQ4_CHEQI